MYNIQYINAQEIKINLNVMNKDSEIQFIYHKNNLNTYWSK